MNPDKTAHLDRQSFVLNRSNSKQPPLYYLKQLKKEVQIF